MRPDDDQYRTDQFDKIDGKKHRDQYYKDLKTGMADPKDFERYIYGGNYGRKFGHDDRDDVEDKVRDKIRKFDHDAKEYIDQVAKENKNN